VVVLVVGEGDGLEVVGFGLGVVGVLVGVGAGLLGDGLGDDVLGEDDGDCDGDCDGLCVVVLGPGPVSCGGWTGCFAGARNRASATATTPATVATPPPAATPRAMARRWLARFHSMVRRARRSGGSAAR